MHIDPEYLGDGVYAEFEHGYILLTLKGQDDSRICLEPEVFVKLMNYAKKVNQAHASEQVEPLESSEQHEHQDGERWDGLS